MAEKVYACLDLKSFYASVECVARGLDPFSTNLVVADPARGGTTICLAVSPHMKELGVANRCRIFEIPDNIDYIVAKPHMKRYMDISAKIYGIYLKYISRDDIHVYSVDECFFDYTPYLNAYGMTPKELAVTMMTDVYDQTGICATAGIGSNLFLAKLALDITAKHAEDHIGFVDKAIFHETLQFHRPITDIWNIGKGIARRLADYGAYDLHDVSIMNEAVLYKLFGQNAEFLIDHAHGIEPCTIADIHNYHSKSNGICNGQILPMDYEYEDALLVLKEMVDMLVLELIDRGLVTNSVSLSVGYSGREAKRTGGTRKLRAYTDSYAKLSAEFERFYRETTRNDLPVRRMNIGLNHITPADLAGLQLDMFSDGEADAREKKMQEAVLAIKQRFGKNAVMRGMSLEDKATGRERNNMVGGHNG